MINAVDLLRRVRLVLHHQGDCKGSSDCNCAVGSLIEDIDNFIANYQQHEIKIKTSEREYHTAECSCGWKSGPWAGFENAQMESRKHKDAIQEHILNVNRI